MDLRHLAKICKKRSFLPPLASCITILFVLLCAARLPAAPANTTVDLFALGIAELMNIEVTSASKKVQRVADVGAAVFVITQEDMRRSGARSIPEALRLAPGVQVARIDANKWAVSIRGFNGRFANKLLVLIDGRSVYTPLFSGVFWDAQDTLLADIDRIEVIRGPGAALWGANAVNGVINIITKSATDTPGGLVSGGGGTEERGFAEARYGMSLSEATDIRFYAKYLDRDSGMNAAGNQAHDAWHMSRGGFRLDSHTTKRDTLTMQGEYYEGNEEGTASFPRLPIASDPTISRAAEADNGVRGGHLMSRWERTLSGTSGMILQLYYDYYQASIDGATAKIDAVDLDFQHRFTLGKKQDIIWGASYRFSRDDIENTFALSLLPPQKDSHLTSFFLHDEIALIPEHLSLVLGARFERNNYSGFEIQPNGRLIWRPTPKHTLWTAVSRAVRTPSRGDQNILIRHSVIPPPLTFVPFPANQYPAVVTIYGSEEYGSEELLAYELGYRTELRPNLNLDVSTFYNAYDRLRTIKAGQPGPDSLTAPTHILIPFMTNNDMTGHTYGAELAVSWLPLPWWRLQISYSYLEIFMDMNGNTTDPHNKADAEGGSPRQQFSIRSGFDLGRKVSWDLWWRGVERLESIGGGSVAGYVTLDTRLAWKPIPQLELSLVGQNLLQKSHAEFRPELLFAIPTETERSFYGMLTWNF